MVAESAVLIAKQSTVRLPHHRDVCLLRYFSLAIPTDNHTAFPQPAGVQLPSRLGLCGGLVEGLLLLLNPVFDELIPFTV